MNSITRTSTLLLFAILATSNAVAQEGSKKLDGRYVNEIGPHKVSFFKAATRVLFADRTDREPEQPIPLRQITPDELANLPSPTLYRLGHSSILLKLGDSVLLVDPVFSKRASPVQWAGPQRFHPVPLATQDLPEIDAVLISHNHYDHLDKASVKTLADKVGYFVVPLGVGDHLRDWGVEDDAIMELDWWDSLELGDLTFIATPAQHFSGRALNDRNKTLWASWVIQGDGANLFFSGDSGYFDGFKEIGERYGPFDLTMVENGAYNDAWRKVHMMPEESVQAHIDLQGRAMLPIHNSTFDLSTHAWYEPLERVGQLATERGIELLTPIIGEPVNILDPAPTLAWWQEMSGEVIAGDTTTDDACSQTC